MRQAADPVEFHDSVDEPPDATAVGSALNCTVGSAVTTTVVLTDGLLPPGPVHSNV